MAVTPDISAVSAHIERQIAEQQDPTLPGQLPHRLPLLIEVPLLQLDPQQVIGMVPAPIPQRFAVVARQGLGPAPPGTLVLVM